MKHTDDDGDLSIFVSGGEVLFACNHGHVWTAQVSIEAHAEKPCHVHDDSGPTDPCGVAAVAPRPGAA
ncbi:hypothetical protein P0Y31_05000 [Knoellia sp. 3-2P3]|uniref:hypothetical protein n=1 Tax=unclassified Knoellia TaxID=2618719 RepID=UPI0023D9D59A|nr:hypothetical protein [Knoellia sp. 3-2P3]MDF2091691.1 hypothetical protein [Knoellia sp. 3-2P3]